jgi:hypothetical protein
LKEFAKSAQYNGKVEPGFFIMTMRQHIQHCQFMNFWLKKNTCVSHPPYSPDLALYDFFLFSRIKSALKEQWFPDLEEIKAYTATERKAIT